MKLSLAVRRPAPAALLAATLALTSLAGCSGLPSEVTSVLDQLGGPTVAEARAARKDAQVQLVGDEELHQADTLTVGILTSEVAPLAITGSDSDIQGIDVDTAYALADELGLSAVSFMSVESVEAGLEAGCDLVMGATSEDTSGTVAVTGSYAQSALGLFGHGSSSIASASELSGTKVGVQSGSVSARALSRTGLDVEQVSFSNLNEAFKALAAGEVDYVACDAYSGAYLASVLDGVSFAGTLGEVSDIGVGVSVSSSTLQSAVANALSEISSNGVAAVARSRWVGELPALDNSTMVSGVASGSDETDAAADAQAADGANDAEDSTPAE